MKHLGFAAALLGMCCAVPAQAARFEANSPEAQTLMKAYFGNTLICKAEGIFECHNWMYPDGKFIQFSWDSRPNVMVDGVMLSDAFVDMRLVRIENGRVVEVKPLGYGY